MNEANELKTITTLDEKPFKHFCVTIGELPSSYIDSMSYYELCAWLCQYLENTVIPAVNANGEAVEELQGLYLQLKEYVDTYFDNLDVQEEINNKLDQMAEDGVIGAMLDHYFDVIRVDIANYEERIDGQIETFQTKLNKFNNNPVAVSDASDMTDHDQIYVLTTDGKWYYWSETDDSFVAGGTYQSAQMVNLSDTDMASKGLTTKAISFYQGYNLRTDFGNEIFGYYKTKLVLNPGGSITSSTYDDDKAITTFLPPNCYVRINKSNGTGRFRVGVSTTRPQSGVSTTILYDNNTATSFCFYNTSNAWLTVGYSHHNAPAPDGTVVDVYVDNRNVILDAIRPENMTICEKVDSTNLFDSYNLITSYGTQGSEHKYLWSYNTNYRSYMFALAPDTDYHIEKVGTSDRFRVCLWRAKPETSDESSGYGYFKRVPSVIVEDDNDETECDFNSGDYLYCTIMYTNSKQSGVSFNITTPNLGTASYWRLQKDYIKDYMLTKTDGGYKIYDEANPDNEIWSMWNARLSYGMTPQTAYVPVYFNSQIFVDGTIMCHNTGSQNNNRWGHHIFDGYSSDQYSRMSMTVDFPAEYNKKHGDLYYYTGTGSGAASYGYIRLGSDTTRHSCKFDRDDVIADAQITCHNPLTIANIDTASDCIFTYDTYAEADQAYYPTSVNNIKAIRGIQMKNAANGTMFYDTARDKAVIKIAGQWCDINTTPVPSGTYDF